MIQKWLTFWVILKTCTTREPIEAASTDAGVF